MKLSNINRGNIEAQLKETDPEKLHEKATDYFKCIMQIPENVDERGAATMFLSLAAFFQARAAYYAAMAAKPKFGRQDC
ncbi:hypothetical protein A2303_06650 [Candidatus Falkowbacteria bacterium RIFOXYB2_FULL_47_14]|uniref:Uncharacterized protein n=1 Tax=Candidatus Falkowbacteria bacterium RIFOXYA2_FULL_47_19 TaxID=1797994 RepID=A0A1F5SGH1_9BACT|nr:MAG: hypothetical protein A2227_00395 [Candidatus Falkowbacteria bacterium RIFOXYA2_FULL_47_19]OGF35538.1 MAG: hypothetical protein A2468_05880 [Candidatus Falkowbacteria bacterium RIFOXYC2_FULL_46_15]OGF43553.1 MAG: hypothetical protein A2303_06650 [Candidatus Falkowbacteria bacterium RIFOXYB2_FULL_47_14]